MGDTFDPYHRWLSIRPEDQPADFYRLLGLSRFEDDPEVIRDAAERQIAHVRLYALGQQQDASHKVLNELARARAVLLDDIKRAEYDRTLRRESRSEPASSDTEVSVAKPKPAIPPLVNRRSPDPPAATDHRPSAQTRDTTPDQKKPAADQFPIILTDHGTLHSHTPQLSTSARNRPGDRQRSLRPGDQRNRHRVVLIGIAIVLSTLIVCVMTVIWVGSRPHDSAKNTVTSSVEENPKHSAKNVKDSVTNHGIDPPTAGPSTSQERVHSPAGDARERDTPTGQTDREASAPDVVQEPAPKSETIETAPTPAADTDIATIPKVETLEDIARFVADSPIPPVSTEYHTRLYKDDHLRGNSYAEITIFEFSSLRNKHSGLMHAGLKKLVDERRDVNWVFRHFPREHDRLQHPASYASEGVYMQKGHLGFWRYLDLCSPCNINSEEDVVNIGVQAGADRDKLVKCLEDEETVVDVSYEVMLSCQQVDIDMTVPTFLFRNNKTGQIRCMMGSGTMEYVNRVVDAMLGK